MLINSRNIRLAALVMVFSSIHLYAQSIEEREGFVTYISSQNVYVRFENTDGINHGDTLYTIQSGSLEPSILIRFISSKSAAGEVLNNHIFKVDDKLVALVHINDIQNPPPVKIQTTAETQNGSEAGIKFKLKEDPVIEKYSGRISVQSYSNFSNEETVYDFQRWRYTLSFDGKNISGTPFSFTGFLNFSYKADEWHEVQSNPGNNTRVYDLALNYNADNDLNIWLGRYLNRRISSISSIDGLQAEKKISDFYLGAVIGSRPDFSNMGYNLKLFEFGGYLGRTDSLENGLVENNLGIFQQTNDFKTDRRFLYFQHNNNNLLPMTNIFFSSEIDLFKKEKGESKNDFSFTGILASIRYSPIREVTASLSYDARRNVIYYETFKNFIDSLIENETRQGLRGNVNLRLVKNLFIGTGVSYRYRKADIKPSRNYNGYVTYSSIPFIESSSTLSYNRIISSYLDGIVWGVGIYKNLPFNNMDLGLNFRNTEYQFTGTDEKQIQNSITVDLGGSIIKPLFFNISYEGIFEKQRTSGRVLFDLTARL